MSDQPVDDVLPDARPTDRTVRRLPEGAREHQGHRAGVVTRTLAMTVDIAVVVGVLVGGWVTWAAARFIRSPETFSWPAPSWILVVSAFDAVAIVYLTVAWATSGRTFGGVLLGVRVVNFRGRRMRPSGALLRALFCVFFPLGLFWVAVSRSNRSVQDVVLRTSAVYDWSQDS
jgi:uncharacterized RDD family membrane protein YckC